MRLLVLISDTGGGHRSAAEAVAAALQHLDEHAAVKFVDFFSACAPFPLNQAGPIYASWINFAAPVWGASFHLTDGQRRAALLGLMISLTARRCVEAKVLTFRPDVLACAHPLATRLATDVRRRVSPSSPLTTIVTDLTDAHATWFTRDIDLLTAPTEAVRLQAVRAGIPETKIRVTGLPVHPRFIQIKADPCAIRKNLGLSSDRFTVLLIGGGEGMGRIAKMAQAIDSMGLHLQQVVICGRNKSLREKLDKTAWNIPTRILGFVHNMPALMYAADVVITKAGPSTICEALVVGRPILIIGYVPGQEHGNVDLVTHSGAGLLTETPQALASALRYLLACEDEARKRMAASARRLARPSAAQDIAQALLSLR